MNDGMGEPTMESPSWRRTSPLRLLIDAELSRRGVKSPSDWAEDTRDLSELARVAARLEPGLANAFRRAIEVANGRVRFEDIEHAVRVGNAGQAIRLFEDAGIWRELLPSAQREVLRAVMAGAQVGSREIARVGIDLSFDLINPYAVEWAANHTAQFVTEIREGQRLVVQDIVATALSGDLDVRGAARQIQDVVGLTARQAEAVATFRQGLVDDGVPADRVDARTARYAEAQLRARGALIARTEILDSANEGQAELWREAVRNGLIDPDNTRRVWLTTSDERLCLTCEPLDGAVAGLNEPFPGGYMRPPDPHPQCRCAIALKFS